MDIFKQSFLRVVIHQNMRSTVLRRGSLHHPPVAAAAASSSSCEGARHSRTSAGACDTMPASVRRSSPCRGLPALRQLRRARAGGGGGGPVFVSATRWCSHNTAGTARPSLLQQLLEKRRDAPVPAWVRHAKAWPVGSNIDGGGCLAAEAVGRPPLLPCTETARAAAPVIAETTAAAAVVPEHGEAQIDAILSSPPALVATAEVAGGERQEEESGEAEWGGATPTSARARAASGQLILDPVQWLAQSYDAPLMQEDLLERHLHAVLYEEQEVMPDIISESIRQQEKAHKAEAEAEAEAAEQDGLVAEALQKVPMTATEAVMDMAATREAATTITKIDSGATVARVSPTDKKPDAALVAAAAVAAPVPTRSEAEEQREAEQAAAPLATPPPLAPIDEETLVYNVFTRRVSKASAPAVRALALLGVGLDATSRELQLQDPSALQALATALRSGKVAWPTMWSRGILYQQIHKLLMDETLTTELEQRVADLLQVHYKRARNRHTVGVVDVRDSSNNSSTTTSDSSDSSAKVTRLHASVESVDDKLFGLHDLNEEQQAVVHFVLQGHNTYVGGSAGTGKSVLLRVLRQQLLKEGLTVAVTATTGIAASHIGGCTLHHCFGINLRGEFTRRKELGAYDVIIIDEVSMLPRSLLESLELHLRRVNGVDLPFGGTQIILCGDFLQLGAVAAQPVLTSAVFRRNFAMLKLKTILRQSTNPFYALQLQALRRGQVPAGLEHTVQFLTTEQVLLEREQKRQLEARQRAELQQVGALPADAPAPEAAEEEEEGPDAPALPPRLAEEGEAESDDAVYVEGAVNLLPTNKQVAITNARQLEKLQGETVTFQPQIMPPTLRCAGHFWSPTYLLRIQARPAAAFDQHKLQQLIEHYVRQYVEKLRKTHEHRWFCPLMEHMDVVLYKLFTDACVLRVRLPSDWEEKDRAGFVQHLNAIDDYFAAVGAAARVREVLLHGEGLHHERDEDLLRHAAARSPMAVPLPLKIGAQVMLRANLAPGLVNGSLGTVVGFRRLHLDQLPHYLAGNAQREEAVMSYRDFLLYEEGFEEAVVPVVDFGGGRVEPIPPLTFYVGGLGATHYYSCGITALPLSLAYAFTVHKVQGLTLVGRVHLELSRMWPCEHLLYVAMSRVRNPEQLSMSSFSPRLVRAAADCVLFDDSLPDVFHVKVQTYFIQATWRRAPQRKKKLLRKAQLARLVKREMKKTAEKEEQRLLTAGSAATDAVGGGSDGAATTCT